MSIVLIVGAAVIIAWPRPNSDAPSDEPVEVEADA